jgi:hypothetical protein
MKTTSKPAAQQVDFNGTPVSVIEHAGQRWITAEEAGRCLSDAEPNVGQGICRKAYRHLGEFGEEDSRQIYLICGDGKRRLTRIFSATGCMLLAKFANTALAKEFRQWAKHVLSGQKPAAQQVDFCGSMPGAFYDLQQRMQSLQAVTRMIPVIGAENGSPNAVEVEIVLANNLVAAVEDLMQMAMDDLELLEFELTGGAHPGAAGAGAVPSAAADGVGAAGMPL